MYALHTYFYNFESYHCHSLWSNISLVRTANHTGNISTNNKNHKDSWPKDLNIVGGHLIMIIIMIVIMIMIMITTVIII